jgi:hypothetical protein
MKSKSVYLLSFAALPIALGIYAGARTGDVAPRTVTVVARDYAFDAPDTLQAGAVRLRLVNQGKELHHIWLGRLENGKTLDDLFAALKSGGPLPAWVTNMGGPNAPRPAGGEATATVSLTPGNYVMACAIPGPDGVPHIMKGMVRTLTVVKTATPAIAPRADVKLTFSDYSFGLSQPLTAGRHLIEVHNEGTQWHEVELVQLAPGKTAHQVIEFIETGRGEPAGLPITGVSPISVGQVSRFDVDLEPGRYAFVCFLPDAKDGKPHFAHGMVREFEVGGR